MGFDLNYHHLQVTVVQNPNPPTGALTHKAAGGASVPSDFGSPSIGSARNPPEMLIGSPNFVVAGE